MNGTAVLEYIGFIEDTYDYWMNHLHGIFGMNWNSMVLMHRSLQSVEIEKNGQILPLIGPQVQEHLGLT